MPEIRILPPEIVNRIAAGEVIERPASLIKELVENSVDAHATEIDIDLEEGGRKKVAVRDNGSGMEPDDLPLAFHSHATSKLAEERLSDGFFSVSSLGFRGEALASIASVADVEVVSRPPKSEHAYRYRPGRGDAEPAAGPQGTVVEVRDLFSGVPARRKFLRGASAELSHIVQQVTRLSLAFPGIRFRVTQNGKKVVDYPRVSTLRERVAQIAGRGKDVRLLEVREGEGDAPCLRGFVGPPDLRRRDSREQHFFVNGRWVRDRTLSHALRAAFQGYLIPGWQPVAYLYLDFPPDSVDVNVHPMKTEVRFREPGAIYPLIFHGVRQALASAGGGKGEKERHAAEASSRAGIAAATLADEERGRIRQAAISFLSSKRASSAEHLRRFSGGYAAPRAGPRPAGRQSAAPRAFQVLDSYIVVEEDEGVTFVDQHALHEKILFEEIYHHLLEGKLVRQKLLVPDVVELPAEYMPLVDRAREFLDPCGYSIEAFGDREVAVHSVPKLFERVKASDDSREFVLEAFRWLQGEGAGFESGTPRDSSGLLRQPYRRLASLLACKLAVKAGTRLSAEEVDSLLEKADLADDPEHCPHGRPTSIRLGRSELENRFDRK